MNLIVILAATLIVGVGSVWLAAAVMRIPFFNAAPSHGAAGGASNLLSLAAGALLATAFMHLLPEAFESGVSPQALFTVLLGSVIFFFLLDKAELWHHGHEHHHGAHAGGSRAEHAHHHDPDHVPAHPPLRSGAWGVLTGDSVHCFGDGVLIASAFMADFRLGLAAAVAVLAHEVPHHMGDLVVLRATSGSHRIAVLKVSLAGAVTMIGGLLGWWLVDRLIGWLPYFLVVASGSFVYVALADLIPQLQRRLGARATTAQVAWLAAGIALVGAVSALSHG